MRSKSGPQSSAEAHVREIRRATRKKHLSGDTKRQATSSAVKELRREMSALKDALTE